MINYEAMMIEANQELQRLGPAEALYVIYPANGMAVADSPLAYVSKGDAAKEEAFLALQAAPAVPGCTGASCWAWAAVRG